MLKHLGVIIGGVVGLLVFHGFLGLLLGVAVGYGLDNMRHRIQRQRRWNSRAFVEPLFALLGAVAKSDGRVSKDEIAVAERMMQRLQLDSSWRERAISAFNQGKQADFNSSDAIRRLREWSGGYRDLLHPILDVLVDTILAEGPPSDAKMQVLRQIAHAFRISELQLMVMLAMKGGAQAQAGGGQWSSGNWGPGAGGAGGQRSAAANRQGFPDPYAVLGLERDADNATIKRTYRKLMSEHHPDRLGELPDDLKRRAQERASTINAAYDQIKQQRGIK